MEFEWNNEKLEDNLAKHGLDFIKATLIFEGAVVSFEDLRKDYGEPRFVSIGVIGEECIVVVHTPSGAKTRIISAWNGGTNDRQKYHNNVASRSTSTL